jgi:hypothetical protein
MKLYEIADEKATADIDDQPLADDQHDITADSWVLSDEADIKVSAYPALEHKFEQVNKRAKKLGVPEITLTIIKTWDRPLRDEEGRKDEWGRTEKVHTVKVTGDTPKLAGWDFLATIEHKTGGNVIRAVPGAKEEDIKAFYEAKPHYCDWCKKSRNRVDTFIVRNHDDGSMKQVGRNCIKDFLGGKDPKSILHWFNWRNELGGYVEEAEEKERGSGRRQEYEIPVENVLTAVATCVRKMGYIKSSGPQGYNGSTPDSVRILLFTRPNKDNKDWFEAMIPTDADKAKAKEVLDWFNALPETEKTSPFTHNIDVIVKGGKASARDIGIVGALLPMHDRFINGEREKKAPKSNDHVGQVGDKIPPTKVTVIRTRVISGQFGSTQIVTMEDEKGNNLVWFNNSSKDLEEKQELTITGTIKKLDDFNGRKQTHLTRVKELDQAAIDKLNAKNQPKVPKVKATPAAPAMTQGHDAAIPAAAPAASTGGSKAAQAVQWFKDQTKANGKAPSRQEFITAMTKLGLSPAGASTYWQKVKSTVVEGMTFTDFLILVG